MPGNGPNSQMAASYPSNEQYERWCERADELDMSVAGFIASMVETGMKVDRGLEVSLQPDKTKQELREKVAYLKDELDHERDKNQKLEELLHRSDSAEIRRFVEDNPGADFDAIKEHLRATVPERAESHLTVMEGDEIRVNPNGLYFPRDDGEDTEDALQEV